MLFDYLLLFPTMNEVSGSLGGWGVTVVVVFLASVIILVWIIRERIKKVGFIIKVGNWFHGETKVDTFDGKKDTADGDASDSKPKLSANITNVTAKGDSDISVDQRAGSLTMKRIKAEDHSSISINQGRKDAGSDKGRRN
jgi:hypothetical protein